MGKLSYNDKLLVGPTKLQNNVSKTSIITSSSAVAKRARDASCLSVVSFNSTNVE